MNIFRGKGIKEKIKILRTLAISACFAIYFMLNAQPVLASGLQSSKLFTGTKKLLEDATAALLIIIPIVGVLAVAYFFMRRSASDEMDHKRWNKAVTTAIVSVILGESVALLLTTILAYYK